MGGGSDQKSGLSITIGLPVLVTLITMAVGAGIGYGVLGANVRGNIKEIKALRMSHSMITGIWVAQGVAATERAGLREDIVVLKLRLEEVLKGDLIEASGD